MTTERLPHQVLNERAQRAYARSLLDSQQALIWNDETLKQKAAAKAAALN